MLHLLHFSRVIHITDPPGQTVDEILVTAENGAKDMYNPGWYFKYVPTQDALLSAIASDECTQPPVEDVASEFAHKSLNELAAALECAPASMALNRTMFAVIDKRTSSDKSLVLCYVEGNKRESVDWVRCLPKNASLYLRGLSVLSLTWDELKAPVEMKRKDVID